MKNLKQQIEELKERLAVLEGMVDRVENKPKINKYYGKFLPENEQLHWWINHHGEIETSRSIDYNVYYNAFPTQESAESEAKYTLISRQYRNFARKLNNEKPFDWNDSYQKKYGVEFFQGVLEIECRGINNYFIHQVAFHKKEHAQLALEVFGDDLLILCS